MVWFRAALILSVFQTAFFVAVTFYVKAVAGLALVAVGVATFRGRRSPSAGEFGTARWAEAADVPHLLDGSGPILGYIAGRVEPRAGLAALFDRRVPAGRAVRTFLAAFRRHPPPHLVRLTDSVHISVFAPTGAGKGVSVLVPFLLASPDTAVVVDVKGELARLTAARRAALGHRVVLIDPFRLVTDAPAAFNPLDGLDADDPEVFDRARAVADAMVVQDAGARDPHWTQKAAAVIAGTILAVVTFCPAGRRSLQEVADILADRELLDLAIRRLRASPAHGGLLARVGGEMALPTDRERDGILSTANRSLAFLGSPAVRESTGGTGGFDPADLGLGRATTVYLILPVKYLRSHAGLLRLWASALLRAVIDRGPREDRPVTVVLDEAAALGHLEAVDDMLAVGRGFGLRMLLVYQSLAQLRKAFPDGQDGVLLGNTTQVFFGVNDPATAEYVSARLGERTQVVGSGGRTWGVGRQGDPKGTTSWSVSWGGSRGWQLGGRRLLRPEEVCRLDPRVAITFHRHLPPLATYLTRYYEETRDERSGRGTLGVAAAVAAWFVPTLLPAVLLAAGLVRRFL